MLLELLPPGCIPSLQWIETIPMAWHPVTTADHEGAIHYISNSTRWRSVTCVFHLSRSRSQTGLQTCSSAPKLDSAGVFYGCSPEGPGVAELPQPPSACQFWSPHCSIRSKREVKVRLRLDAGLLVNTWSMLYSQYCKCCLIQITCSFYITTAKVCPPWRGKWAAVK